MDEEQFLQTVMQIVKSQRWKKFEPLHDELRINILLNPDGCLYFQTDDKDRYWEVYRKVRPMFP